MKKNYKIAEWIKIATTYDLKISTLKQLDFEVKYYNGLNKNYNGVLISS